ncbi:acetolactate synthase-1/2/3 large subunit [Archangium gephyra]|uniref:Acetolactate synthase large subunit n=1 Tax=Archangium gephyra TaxID=48 RepID=A0AAC8TBW2_9BACT|nr:Acetolactate synthase large subunit [Archangium gephyra]REG33045.1 acetolactate synthase-1/2/3 large subunit [Archangium gephyra]
MKKGEPVSQPALAKALTSALLRGESSTALFPQGMSPLRDGRGEAAGANRDAGAHPEPHARQEEPRERLALRSFHSFEELTVAEALLAHLEAEQVDAVFGIPGGNIAPLVQALRRQSRIRFIIGSHEGGSAFMADGYARATGKLGVCAVTAGPGATNAMTGVASAHLDQVPVLTISGQVSTERFGLGAIQESTDEGGINTGEMFRHCTASSTTIVDARSFPRLLERALKTAHAVPHGAVHVSIPTNIARQKLAKVNVPSAPGAWKSTLPAAPASEVYTAFELLRHAKRPLVYLGSGAREALESRGAEFAALVRRYCIPVATSLRGKGLFSEEDPLSLGVLGIAGSKRAEQYLAEGVDVLMVLGSRLGEWATKSFSTLFETAHTVIQVDATPSVIGQFLQVNLPIVADVGSVVAGMVEFGHGSTPGNEAHVRERRQHLNTLNLAHRAAAPVLPEDGPLKPQHVMEELNPHLHANTDLYVDMGNCTGWATHCLRITPPARVFYPCGLSSMGWSMGAVIGGKVGKPENTAIALTGDGSFLMNGTELVTAVRYGVGAVYIVLNDNYLGMVNHGEHAQSGGEYELDDPYFSLGDPDLVKFSESLGARAYEVTKPGQLAELLPEVLKRADEERRPQVLVCRIDYREVPPYGDRFAAVASAPKED